MEYGWQIPSDFYFVINGSYIGKINTTKRCIEQYYREYSRPWELEIATPLLDFDLEEMLLNSTFNVYEKRYVRRKADGKEDVIYYEYNNCEITKTFKNVDASTEPYEFTITINSRERERIINLPEQIKE